jgi:hypothetical protein
MRNSTKYLAAVVALSVGMASPFMVAAQVPQKSSPRLANVMGALQSRHSKLWTAAQQQNWELAAYQLELVKAGLADAIGLYTEYRHPRDQRHDDRRSPQITRWRDRGPEWRSIRQGVWRTHYRMQFLSSVGRPRVHRHDGSYGVAFRQSIVCAARGAGQGRHAPVRDLAGCFRHREGEASFSFPMAENISAATMPDSSEAMRTPSRTCFRTASSSNASVPMNRLMVKPMPVRIAMA